LRPEGAMGGGRGTKEGQEAKHALEGAKKTKYLSPAGERSPAETTEERTKIAKK